MMVIQPYSRNLPIHMSAFMPSMTLPTKASLLISTASPYKYLQTLTLSFMRAI